jgi:hypothetical protein
VNSIQSSHTLIEHLCNVSVKYGDYLEKERKVEDTVELTELSAISESSTGSTIEQPQRERNGQSRPEEVITESSTLLANSSSPLSEQVRSENDEQSLQIDVIELSAIDSTISVEHEVSVALTPIFDKDWNIDVRPLSSAETDVDSVIPDSCNSLDDSVCAAHSDVMTTPMLRRSTSKKRHHRQACLVEHTKNKPLSRQKDGTFSRVESMMLTVDVEQSSKKSAINVADDHKISCDDEVDKGN